MKIKEIIEGAVAWKKSGDNKLSRRYRCQSGPRKGRVMASPASCNAPLNHKKRSTLLKNKGKSGSHRKFQRKRTMRKSPASRRLNKVQKRKK